MKVKEILKVTKGKMLFGNEELEVENFSKDTRTIQKGDIYIGIKGEKFDGSNFWNQALDAGATAVIISNIQISKEEKEKYKDKTIIQVEDTFEALYEIAKYKRSLYNIPVIAVTGSVGKTSTKDIIASVVSQKYKTLKTEGNNNNNIGLPLTILKLKDHEALVVEMGMNHFGEISLLTNIAKPTLAVITNIGTSHIGNLGSRENILKAKLEILEGMKIPRVIINNDNDLLHRWYEENKEKIEIHTYGINNSSDVIAEKIELGEEKSKFVVKTSSEKVNIDVPVGGEHFVYNALCGFMVGKVLGLTAKEIQNGISKFELTKKRMDIRVLKNGATLINDSYNASYESMKASLKYLSSRTDLRKIAVLGDMLELGDFSKELHEKVGEEVANDNIDVLICRGEFAKNIISKANKNKKTQCILLQNNEEILSKLQEILKEGDGVLIKASNGMKFYEICQKL
jgi:UDP-N-acetylmuramoyl-tripeptide--D-alanyl-D-alanine ligase